MIDKTILRVEKNPNNPFVMMDKRPLENPKMSLKAKGLLAYLLSRPDNWEINMHHLVKQSKDGESATRAAVKELQTLGHIEAVEIRDKGKFNKVIYIVKELPSPYSEKPHTVKPHTVNPHTENLALNNKDSNKKENKDSCAQKTCADEIDLFVPANGTSSAPSPDLKKERQPTPRQLRCERLEKVFAEERGRGLPDWATDPKAANKLWRIPLDNLYKICEQDEALTEKVIRLSVRQMLSGRMTFSVPIQIMKVAEPIAIDLQNGRFEDNQDETTWAEEYS